MQIVGEWESKMRKESDNRNGNWIQRLWKITRTSHYIGIRIVTDDRQSFDMKTTVGDMIVKQILQYRLDMWNWMPAAGWILHKTLYSRFVPTTFEPDVASFLLGVAQCLSVSMCALIVHQVSFSTTVHGSGNKACMERLSRILSAITPCMPIAQTSESSCFDHVRDQTANPCLCLCFFLYWSCAQYVGFEWLFTAPMLKGIQLLFWSLWVVVAQW